MSYIKIRPDEGLADLNSKGRSGVVGCDSKYLSRAKISVQIVTLAGRVWFSRFECRVK